MTQEQVDVINKVDILLRMHKDEVKKAKRREKDMCKMYWEVREGCDHTYPDGRSALQEVYYMMGCEICGGIG